MKDTKVNLDQIAIGAECVTIWLYNKPIRAH